eukprot:TRINITY_DN2804_c0_g1_i1.p1 TRINITY_DN2804_c0_g1~~TRINITY_DN2804_c0_g1_i1.p1  ORF type:complete len:199 (-),score=54.23 TRINITY_DN2804_c0_g1_i1:241-807(-)
MSGCSGNCGKCDGGCGHANAAPVVRPVGSVDLLPFVNTRNVECYNESVQHTKEAVLNNSATFVESDCGTQLLLHVPFTQHVRLTGLALKASETDAGACPKEVCLFLERPGLSLADALDAKPTQCFTLDNSAATEEKELSLRPTLYQNVSCLSILVKSNYGSATTRLCHIDMSGVPRAGLNMSEFKRVG